MLDVKEQKKISTIVFVFFILRFINCFIPASTAYVLFMTVVEASAFILYSKKYSIRFSYRIYAIIGIMVAFEVTSWAFFGENHFLDLINTLLGLFLGFYMAKSKIVKKMTVFLLVIFSGIVILRLIISGSPNRIFLRASRNNISAFFILVAVLYYSTSERNERVPLFPAIITFVFSCIGEGRGGVVSSFFLLAGVVLYNLFTKKKPTLFQICVSIIGFGLFLYLITNYYDVLFSKAVDRLYSQKFMENERNNIIASYFDNIRFYPVFLVFGVPSRMIPVVVQLNGNFHNSYLSLHSHFGLIGFIIIFILLMYAIKQSILNRSWVYLLLLFVICVRIFTDGLCFVGLYDPIFYYIVFLCIMDTRNEFEEGNNHESSKRIIKNIT